MNKNGVSLFLSEFTQWASAQTDILAVALVGSYARDEATETSDVDLVITADIPLAAEVIAKGAHALNPRGELYTRENIGGRLNMRDFMDSLRGSGIQSGGPPPLNHGDRQAFANALDRWLAQNAPRP